MKSDFQDNFLTMQSNEKYTVVIQNNLPTPYELWYKTILFLQKPIIFSMAERVRPQSINYHYVISETMFL